MQAGQWVDFFIPGEAQVGGFSMWNHPQDFSDHDRIELAVKVLEFFNHIAPDTPYFDVFPISSPCEGSILRDTNPVGQT